jgi:hypothetical protein
MPAPQTVAWAGDAAPDTGPPVVLFIPGIEESPANTAQRIAELIALDLTRGAGSFTVEHGPTAVGAATLADHWRIVDSAGLPVLDLSAVDYRPCLKKDSVKGEGIKASVLQVVGALSAFGSTVVLLFAARKRAKTAMARAQLWVGFGAGLLLLALLGLTIYSAGAALGAWKIPKLPEKFADVASMGVVAVFTWALLKSKPRIEAATDIIRQFLDYAHDVRVVKGTTNVLRDALDPLVQGDGPRKVHLVSYSFGSLVALDLLFPKTATLPAADPRYATSIASLTTIACPVDFMRLYFPDYLEGRTARFTGLRWTNVFIAADVFGSNFLDEDDFAETPDGAEPLPEPDTRVAIDGCRPTSVRYTDEQLSLKSIFVGARGFATHSQYWGDPDRGNCLRLVTDVVLAPAPTAV